jgi:hypothetical protein
LPRLGFGFPQCADPLGNNECFFCFDPHGAFRVALFGDGFDFIEGKSEQAAQFDVLPAERVRLAGFRR